MEKDTGIVTGVQLQEDLQRLKTVSPQGAQTNGSGLPFECRVSPLFRGCNMS